MSLSVEEVEAVAKHIVAFAAEEYCMEYGTNHSAIDNDVDRQRVREAMQRIAQDMIRSAQIGWRMVHRDGELPPW